MPAATIKLNMKNSTVYFTLRIVHDIYEGNAAATHDSIRISRELTEDLEKIRVIHLTNDGHCRRYVGINTRLQVSQMI